MLQIKGNGVEDLKLRFNQKHGMKKQLSQPVITCSNLTIETLGQVVKDVQS